MIVILILTLYREAKHNFPFCMHSTFNSIRGKMLNNAFRMFVIIECCMFCIASTNIALIAQIV